MALDPAPLIDPDALREVPEPVVDAPVDEPVPSSEEEATAEPPPEQDPTEELGG